MDAISYSYADKQRKRIDDIDTLLTSNDTTLDELQEIVTFIKANRSDLDAITLDNIVEGVTNKYYTLTEKNKLAGIEERATADQTKADIDALNINSATVNGLTVETAVPAGAIFTGGDVIPEPYIEIPLDFGVYLTKGDVDIESFDSSMDKTYVARNGNLVMTSGSAPRFESDGYVVEHHTVNYCENSENLSGAAWNNTGVTLTLGADSPYSDESAGYSSYSVASTTVDNPSQVVAVDASTEHSWSMFVKKVDTDWLRVEVAGSAMWFNASNGSVGTSNLGTIKVESMYADWFRISGSATSDSNGDLPIKFASVTADNSTTTSGSVTVWGVQVTPMLLNYIPEQVVTEYPYMRGSHLYVATSKSIPYDNSEEYTYVDDILNSDENFSFFIDINSYVPSPVMDGAPGNVIYTASYYNALFINGTNLISFIGASTAPVTIPITVSNSMKIAVTITNSVVTIYLNGVSISTYTGVFSPTTYSPGLMYEGAKGIWICSLAEPFMLTVANIKNVKIYKYGLTSDEVSMIHG